MTFRKFAERAFDSAMRENLVNIEALLEPGSSHSLPRRVARVDPRHAAFLAVNARKPRSPVSREAESG